MYIYLCICLKLHPLIVSTKNKTLVWHSQKFQSFHNMPRLQIGADPENNLVNEKTFPNENQQNNKIN